MTLGQLMFTKRGFKSRIDLSIDRLKTFEPPEGYFVAFSGGKYSQCIYHLCKMTNVKFDAHYSVTSVDPPELVRFIRSQYPDVHFDYPRHPDGTVITMWNLIPKMMYLPTRTSRYCCSTLKESAGKGRIVVTGVRWAESTRRKESRGIVDIAGKPKSTQRIAQQLGAEFKVNKSGALVLNDDNDEARRMVEQCYRTQKTIVNPIVDWTDEDVWDFLNNVVKAKHCELYDEGWKRLGCIGCPMSDREKEFKRWPKYKENYLRTFERMLEERTKVGKNNTELNWSSPEMVMKWWMKEETDDE